LTQNKNKKKTNKKASPEKKAKPSKKAVEENKKAVEENKKGEELEKQVAAEKDKILRLSAEFENYKKRKQRELDSFKKFANESILKQFLTVVDNLERAISSAEENSDAKAFLKGVELTHKEIIKLFETFSVKPVKAENQIFDPNFHQAVTQEESDKVPDNTITKVLQKGYLLHDRLIRPAMVVVSKGKKEKENSKKENNKN
jgi:molecular chaperone GrpE